MTHHHRRLFGMFGAMHLLHGTSAQAPARHQFCKCNLEDSRPHSVNCIMQVSKLANKSVGDAELESLWEMGWEQEPMPFGMPSNAGVAYTMGRDYRNEHLDKQIIPDVKKATLTPIHT